MTKLLRSVGLNGMPTAQQITEDAAFLLIVVRPEFYERKKTAEVSQLLSIMKTLPSGSSTDVHIPS